MTQGPETGYPCGMSAPTPPRAPEIPHVHEEHGRKRPDPWYWLRERANPSVVLHLEAENAYTSAMLAPVANERARVLAELKGRIQQDDASLPFLKDGWLYYRRFEAGKEYPLYARKRGLDSPEELLLDVNELAVGRDFCEVHFPDPSPDGKSIVYAADFEGRRFFDLFVKDLATGRVTSHIPRTAGDAVWAADSRTLLYCKQDEETLRSRWVFRHEPGAADALVFEESDDTFDVGVGDSRTGNFLFLVSNAKMSSEWRVLPAKHPKREPTLFLPREEEHEYSLEDTGEDFLVLSNWGATNFRVFRAPHAGGAKETWRELIPHRDDVLVEGVDCFATHIVLAERADGQTRLAVLDRTTGNRREVTHPDPVHVVGLEANEEYHAPFVRFRYESLHKPPSLFDYDFASGESRLMREQPVPTYDASNYETERRWAVARDGARVPLSIVRHKRTARDGTAPLLVYGYGSYGLSMEPWFLSDAVSLLDRGFIFAIAHVRGGSEMGRHWYDDGKLFRKLNTFHDFIDATEFLVKEGYGARERVYANGASAGGLLMGVVVNERPDLYRGVIAGVPFVDVLTTMLDDTIPLTTSEYDEWGDPNDEKAYWYMSQYSPYDNARAQAYPAILATSGFHDSQVQYWEPTKWVAKLRQLSTSARPLLLHTEMDAGHGGASGRFEALEQIALEYAFLLLCDAPEARK